MPQAVTETHDIQALVKAGFSSLTEAAFLLCQVKDAAAAKAVLADLPVTSVADLHARQGRVIQVAISAGGLSALGMTPSWPNQRGQNQRVSAPWRASPAAGCAWLT